MQKDLTKLFGTTHGLDEKSLDFLVKALEKNNLPGFDYIEFKLSLANLLSLNLDENTAYKSVYATAMSVGLTKEKLIKTATHYQQILAREKELFDDALQKQMEQRVQAKIVEVEKLKQQVQEYHQKIQELYDRISKAQETINRADEDIQESKNRIQSTKESFEYTHQSIMNQVSQDIINIQNYL
jgi:methyl-accepting chemotaxis protein